MALVTKAIKGTQDVLPSEVYKNQFIESTMLDEGKNNFLGCVYASKKHIGLCFADISTGSVHLTQFENKNSQKRVIN